jgi:hypothetical protein
LRSIISIGMVANFICTLYVKMNRKIEEVTLLIPESWLNYIADYFLLKDEFLDVINIGENSNTYDIPVVKRTARTRRVVAQLTVGINEDDLPPDELVKRFSSPRVKKQFQNSKEIYKWIRDGWIIREYRLKKDGRSIKSEQYRMGYPLYKHQQQMHKQIWEENKKLVLNWKNQRDKMNKPSKSHNPIRYGYLEKLDGLLSAIAGETDQILRDQRNKLAVLNTNWRFKKQILFSHFLLALYHVSLEEQHYDWKQIGASYYKRIGGSKEFDVHKKEFIEEAERILELPLQLFGLASLGTITPIFFTGDMRATKVAYNYGSVHATTDLAVLTDTFETEAFTLWLVENRGILTRMAYEERFLIDSKSLVLGIDGQLRSAHRQLIEQLVSCVKQVIIWTDIDEAGLTIARDVSKVIKTGVMVKWVVPPLKIATSLNQVEEIYKQSIQEARAEQEQEIGGVMKWKEWIKQ